MSAVTDEAMQAPLGPQAQQTVQVQKRRMPLLASFLSFLAPGIGQYYNGQWKKALLLLIVYFGLGVVTLYLIMQIIGMFLIPVLVLIWLIAIVDAFLSARKINGREAQQS